VTTPSEVTAFYARIWNAGDLDAIRSVAHDDFTFRGSLGRRTRGYEGFIEYARSIRASLDAYHCEILACVCEGDRAFAKMSYSGHHVRAFFGYEPTGLRVQWIGTALFHFDRGKIADLWVLGDLHGLESQLRANERTISGA
jgi:predicted ester cyclase